MRNSRFREKANCVELHKLRCLCNIPLQCCGRLDVFTVNQNNKAPNAGVNTAVDAITHANGSSLSTLNK